MTPPVPSKRTGIALALVSILCLTGGMITGWVVASNRGDETVQASRSAQSARGAADAAADPVITACEKHDALALRLEQRGLCGKAQAAKKKASEAVSKVEVLNGTDGSNGTDGRDGEPPSFARILNVVKVCFASKQCPVPKDGSDGKDGVSIKGEPGRDGTDGAPGANGTNGTNGADGQDFQTGTYSCPDGSYVTQVTANQDGTLTLNCTTPTVVP